MRCTIRQVVDADGIRYLIMIGDSAEEMGKDIILNTIDEAFKAE